MFQLIVICANIRKDAVIHRGMGIRMFSAAYFLITLYSFRYYQYINDLHA